MNGRHVTDRQQVLAELAREGIANRQETSSLVSPGVGAGPWAVKVLAHVEYNLYTVRRVIIEDVNTNPTEVGEPMEAFNLAEPFTATGTLAPGTHAILHRLGTHYAFQA